MILIIKRKVELISQLSGCEWQSWGCCRDSGLELLFKAGLLIFSDSQYQTRPSSISDQSNASVLTRVIMESMLHPVNHPDLILQIQQIPSSALNGCDLEEVPMVLLFLKMCPNIL